MADHARRRHHWRRYRALLAMVPQVMTGKNRIMICGPKDREGQSSVEL
jgi:hypothetical protein